MTSLAARTIAALRHEHDVVGGLASTFSDAQLSAPSGASEWTTAQVLSHLGSGAEIGLAGLQVALGQREALEEDFNQSVWNRWDAMSPADQRAGYLVHDNALVEAFEALTPEQHASLTVPVAYLPTPLSVATIAGFRLSEAAHHSWDVRVAVDPDAELLESSTAVFAEQMSTDLGFLLGFLGKADRIDRPVSVALGETGYSIVIADTVSLGSAAEGTTATFSGSLAAGLRLITGRLKPAHTPADVTVTGNVTLDELREVFPGF